MRTKQKYLKLLSEYKQKRGLFNGISRICIFGSVTRDEQIEDSDVDVCVNLVYIKEELKQLFRCDVDIIRFHHDMNALLRHGIQEEGVYL